MIIFIFFISINRLIENDILNIYFIQNKFENDFNLNNE